MENMYILNPRFKIVSNSFLLDKLTLISYPLETKVAHILMPYMHEQRPNPNIQNGEKQELLIFFQLLQKKILLSISSSSPLYQAFQIVY